MFSLTGATRFRYIPNYKDMRGGYDKLCGVVRTLTGKMEEGTAYVFTCRADAVRCIINNRLNTVDRTIILLYIDCQSMEKLGRLLGFSKTTAFKEVHRVKKKILDIYTGKI